MDITTGEGADESGEGRRSKAAMPVRDKASERKRVEWKKSSGGGWRKERGGSKEKPKVRGRGFEASQERQGRSGSVKDEDRGRCEDGVSVRVEERGDAHKGMRQSRVGEKVAGDGRGLERK